MTDVYSVSHDLIQVLPLEVWCLVLKKLDTKSLRQTLSVNKAWQRKSLQSRLIDVTCNKSFRDFLENTYENKELSVFLKTLILNTPKLRLEVRNLSSNAKNFFEQNKMMALETLVCWDFIGATSLNAVVKAAAVLKTLDLQDCYKLKAEDFMFLENCINLREVALYHSSINGKGLAVLIKAAGVNLQKLNLSFCRNLATEDFILLKDCLSLKEINLSRSSIDGKGLSILIKTAGADLRKLDLSSCQNLNAEDFVLLENCPVLREVNLSDSSINGKGLAVLIKTTGVNLQKLDLCLCASLTISDYRELGRHPQFKNFTLCRDVAWRRK
jgi:hypothetical protein